MTEHRGTALGTASAVAPVPFGRIRELVLAIRPGVFGPEAQQLLGLPDGSRLLLEVDPERLTVAIQGQLWYRGEFSYGEHTDGTVLTHRVVNVSSIPDALVRLWQRSALRRLPADTAAMADGLAQRVR